MPTIDDLIDNAKPPETSEEARVLVSAVLDATDVPVAEKDAFAAGYVAGLAFAVLTQDVPKIATELVLRMHEHA
jgi:hypothetical protein